MDSTSSSAVPSQASRPREQVTVLVEQVLDLAQVDAVRAALSSVLATRALPPGAQIVLEMSECDFVDGTGYRLLREAADLVEQRGYVLHLTGVRADVARILARLDRVLRGGVQQHVLDLKSPTRLADRLNDDRPDALVTIGWGSEKTRPASVEGMMGDGSSAWS